MFSKINFSLKTLEIGKCPQRQQDASLLNARVFFLRKFCWISNLLWLSPRYLPHTCDVAFRYSALSSLIIVISPLSLVCSRRPVCKTEGNSYCIMVFVYKFVTFVKQVLQRYEADPLRRLLLLFHHPLNKKRSLWLVLIVTFCQISLKSWGQGTKG